ncbi:MAG: hypothetical protein WD059_11460 [Balneolaceae bacterium]
MNTDSKFYKSIAWLALATGALLMIPLIAMQYTDEVVWTLSDFIFAGTLLFGTGFTYKFITRKSGKIVYRVVVGFALFTGLFLIWTNGAVGIIGSENNEINLLYFGVIAVGIIGAFIARFQSERMVFTLFAMALTQLLITVIALFTGMHQLPGSSVYEILAVNGFFIMLFVLSALLFRYAAQEQSALNENSAD